METNKMFFCAEVGGWVNRCGKNKQCNECALLQNRNKVKTNTPKQFLTDNPVFNHSALCKEIDWAESSFSRWLSGERGIPKDKEIKLIALLSKYGYK